MFAELGDALRGELTGAVSAAGDRLRSRIRGDTATSNAPGASAVPVPAGSRIAAAVPEGDGPAPTAPGMLRGNLGLIVTGVVVLVVTVVIVKKLA